MQCRVTTFLPCLSLLCISSVSYNIISQSSSGSPYKMPGLKLCYSALCYVSVLGYKFISPPGSLSVFAPTMRGLPLSYYARLCYISILSLILFLQLLSLSPYTMPGLPLCYSTCLLYISSVSYIIISPPGSLSFRIQSLGHLFVTLAVYLVSISSGF